MKFREHKGGLTESMATVVELADRAQLVDHIRSLLLCYPTAPPVTQDTVRVESYIYDTRTQWHTHIVTLDGYGPIGFTDGMPP